MLKNKRGSTGIGGLFIFIIVCILALPVIFMLIFVFTGSASATNLDPEIRYKILTEKFIEDKNCLAYEDSIVGNKIPNTIDFAKFSAEHLDSCYYLLDNTGVPAFKILLRYSEGKEQKELLYQTKNWYGIKSNLVITKELNMVKDNKIGKATVIFYIKDGI